MAKVQVPCPHCGGVVEPAVMLGRIRGVLLGADRVAQQQRSRLAQEALRLKRSTWRFGRG